MNEEIKFQLIYKQVLVCFVCILLAVVLAKFIPYQLSKATAVFGSPGQKIEFPPLVTYALIVSFTLKPALQLVTNLITLKKWGSGVNPTCPSCQYPMVKRIARRGQFIGQKFWGCYKFPKCRGKIHIG